MKKKIVAVLLAACLALAPSLSSADELMDITRAAGYTEATEAYRPKSTLLIDGNTGDVLWEENADEVRDPASMSKAMTLIWSLKLCLKERFQKILLSQLLQPTKLLPIFTKFPTTRLLRVLIIPFQNSSL